MDPFESLPQRNPARIPELLEFLRRRWEQNPDQRFFQLIDNLKHDMGVSDDSYQVEDEQVIEALRSLTAGGNG